MNSGNFSLPVLERGKFKTKALADLESTNILLFSLNDSVPVLCCYRAKEVRAKRLSELPVLRALSPSVSARSAIVVRASPTDTNG